MSAANQILPTAAETGVNLGPLQDACRAAMRETRA
jgi:hypothetical protein